MSLSRTVHNWSKEVGKVGKEPSNYERHAGRMRRPARKNADKIRKMAAKMKKEGYPNRFTSDKEQETHE